MHKFLKKDLEYGQLKKFYEKNDTLVLLKTRLYNRKSVG